ncbi:MAG: hypothetical protein WCS93_07240, partial [Candidatus Delongbacteria bacterium]
MGSNNNNISDSRKGKIDVLGFIMVITPLISSVLIWYWFYNIEYMKNMLLFLIVVSVSTVLLTTILATLDSHRLGLKV